MESCFIFSSLFTFILIIPFLNHEVAAATLNSGTKINQLLSYFRLNGKRHIAVTSLDFYDPYVIDFQYKFLEHSQRHNVYSNQIVTTEEGAAGVAKIVDQLDYYTDSLLLIASSFDTSQWDAYLDLLTKVEERSATIIFPEAIDPDKKEMLLSKLASTQQSRFFYWIYPTEGSEISYHRVITLVNVNHVAVNQLNFNMFGHIIEDYDLQGMHILSTTVSWPPYIYLNDECKSKKLYNKDCKPTGHLVDTLNAMGEIMNFTWECHGDLNDNYGTTPIDGPPNENGTWGGVVGDVFLGNYHFSMSTWVWKEERQNMFDFATYVTDQTALAITLKAKEIDYTLFTRPFRLEAWLLVGFAAIVFILATVVPYLFAPNFGESTSLRLIEAIAWTFFMLTEIYYSGALTMFFSTAPTLPFETVEQVMSEYPTWKLMMQKGNDVYFVYKVLGGDPDYVAFWERVKNEPDDAIYTAIDEGMDKVLNGFYVAHMQEGNIKGWVRENPVLGDKVKIFARGKAQFYTIILTNNSPIGKVFSTATRELIEKGAIDRISAYWLERKKTSTIPDLESTLIVLKPGQMILMYFLVFLMIVASLTVFGLESLWSCSGGDRLQKNVEAAMKDNEYLNMG